jgi:hypothetical protein
MCRFFSPGQRTDGRKSNTISYAYVTVRGSREATVAEWITWPDSSRAAQAAVIAIGPQVLGGGCS